MSDWADDPKFRAWERDVRENMIPKMEQSGAVVSLVPTGETDVKFAVELGMSIMLNKPIVAVVIPGARVPEKLVAVADAIFEADLLSPEGNENLQARIAAFLDAMPEEGAP